MANRAHSRYSPGDNRISRTPCSPPRKSAQIKEYNEVGAIVVPNVLTPEEVARLFQFRAADAWPLLGFPDGIEKFNDLIVAGQSREPRLEHLPVRLTLPPAVKQGSLYENQKGMKNRFFTIPETARVPEVAQ
jgi:hypothetical protein